MNFKKLICEAWGKKWDFCDYYWDTVVICDMTKELARPECPAKLEVRLKKDDVPKTVCGLHEPPVPPPEPKVSVCAVTGLQASVWCPTYEIPTNVAPALTCRKHAPVWPKNIPSTVAYFPNFGSAIVNFDDEKFDRFAGRLGAGGVRYLRFISVWEAKPKQVLPFFRNDDNLANWELPNPEYDRQLARIQRVLGKYGVGVWDDLFAQQFNRQDYKWSPFRFNVNGLDGWDDTSDAAMKKWGAWIDRHAAAIGKVGNAFGWGNELVFGNENQGDTPDKDNWARAWAVPLAEHMVAIGIPQPVPMSAGKYTGKAIYNRIVKQAGWAWRDSYHVIHGCAIPEAIDQFQPTSVQKHYGVSDDGIGLGGNVLPEEKWGLTVSETGRHSSHWTYKVDMVKYAKEFYGNRFRCFEVMPMEFKFKEWDLDRLHQEESVDVFWRAILAAYGVDIRRNIAPK
jgi:hypothetical protein